MATKITLTQPHEHAGRDYPAGAVLTLDDDAADWLVSLGVARETVAEPEPATVAKAKPKAAK